MSRSAKPSVLERQAFLAEINAELPPDIDWKQGAIEYLRELVQNDGPHNTLYHLNKPFLGGPDFAPFFRDMGNFLNMAQALDLPMKSSVLDVACGPGWVAHYFAKLGHRVVGIDISEELVELARRRIAAEPFTTFLDVPLETEFRVHDIEAGPLATTERFDVAYLESCLHHFYDPVAALEHLGESLTPSGRLCLIEAGPPPPGSPEAAHNREVMERYATLERPFTRSQLERLLDLTGFRHRRFYSSIHGLFENNRAGLDRLRGHLAEEPFGNLCIASRDDPSLAVERSAVAFLDGFFAEEGDADESIRWAGVEARLRLEAGATVEMTLGAHDLGQRGGRQTIHIARDGVQVDSVELSTSHPQRTLPWHADRAMTLTLTSDRCFSPAWSGGEDGRLLSFLCRLREV